MRKIVMSVYATLLCAMGYAQDLPKIVPPSPESSALSEFTNVPVSHYTGVPNISVPIYTIQQKGIQIPVNLSYHARGVMVSETAPRTGMGWSLTYGGSITRQTRGKGDESPNGGYLSNGGSFSNYSLSENTRNLVNSNETENPSYDFYPDQFNFNAGSTSGKFVLDYSTGQPVIQSFGDVKITYTREGGHSGMIDSFIVKDSRGNTFYYGKSKDGLRTGQDYQDSSGKSVYYNGNVVLDPTSSGSERVYSAWKLMDIETSYGELISYFYEGADGSYERKVFDMHQPDPISPNSMANMTDITKIYSRVSKVWNYEKQLSKIEFNGGRDRIVFTKSSTGRQDYDGFALGKISIYNGSKLIKAFNLNYTYTTSTDDTSVLSHLKGTADYTRSLKRMFLTSVEEEGHNGDKLPAYEFTYDTQVLPSTYSSKQDYWGYYNGAENNGPFTRIFDYGYYKPNRRVDVAKSEAGILKQIKYPTGGITKLTYEHNIGTAPTYTDKIKLPGINPGVDSEVNIELNKGDFTYNSTTGYTPYNINIPPNTEVKYRFECVHLRDIGDTTTPDCLFSFTVEGNGVNINENITLYTGSLQTYDGTISIGVLTPRFPGVDPDLHLGRNYNFRITISYDTPDDYMNLYGAGKRIKKIETIDEGGNSIIKEYEYTFPVDPIFNELSGKPSGGIIGFPAFINKNLSGSGIANYTKYNDTGSAYSSFQGNTVGYSAVIEYDGTKDNNKGKTAYTFTNLSDSGGDYYEFPYHPPTDNEWLRGKNVRTKVFKKNEDGSYALVKEVYNKYKYGDIEYTADFEYTGGIEYPNFVFTPAGTTHDWTTNVAYDYINNEKVFRLPLFMRTRANSWNVEDYEYRIYHLTGGTVNLDRTVETNYHDSGNFVTTTKYLYDYNNHYQVAGSEVTNSQGEVYKTTNDYSVLSNPFRVLPTKTKGYKGATKLSEQNTVYTNFGSLYLPSKVQTSKAGQGLEERVTYHSYDDKGNPTEVSKKDGTHIVYIWGYNKTQPIAKIENATLSDIPTATITDLQNKSNVDVNASTEATLRTTLNNLRNISTLSKAQISTFTYDPLIGVTSVTDPRGITMYYEYDSFNRLHFVKDKDGNILKEHTYNYKN